MKDSTENLFAYGTLRYPNIQKALFKRILTGVPDSLCGYKITTIEIHDIKTDQMTLFPNIFYTNNQTDRVDGFTYRVSLKELRAADRYEGKDYERVRIQLLSGIKAWVYIGIL